MEKKILIIVCIAFVLSVFVVLIISRIIHITGPVVWIDRSWHEAIGREEVITPSKTEQENSL